MRPIASKILNADASRSTFNLHASRCRVDVRYLRLNSDASARRIRCAERLSLRRIATRIPSPAIMHATAMNMTRITDAMAMGRLTVIVRRIVKRMGMSWVTNAMIMGR